MLSRFGAAAYERRSLAIASHWPFEEWGRSLPDETQAVPLLDRLLHHGIVVVIPGLSLMPWAPSRNDRRDDMATTRPRPACGQGFTPQDGAVTCTDRCGQEASRRRHEPGAPELPVPAKGAKRALAAHASGTCGERALSERYWPGYRTFVTSLGTGALCSTCDRPVALTELLGYGRLPLAGGQK